MDKVKEKKIVPVFDIVYTVYCDTITSITIKTH